MNFDINRIVAKYGCIPKGTTHYVLHLPVAYRVVDRDVYYFNSEQLEWLPSTMRLDALRQIPVETLLECYIKEVDGNE